MKKQRPAVPLFHQSEAPPERAARNALTIVAADVVSKTDVKNSWEAKECGLRNGCVGKAYWAAP